tara:strand:- start:1006 stop:1281 length:276 start_codon:yes stop_codon:yes gene_type:complete
MHSKNKRSLQLDFEKTKTNTIIMGDQDDADLENYFSMSYNNLDPIIDNDFSPKNMKKIKQTFQVKKREKLRKSKNKSVNFSRNEQIESQDE